MTPQSQRLEIVKAMIAMPFATIYEVRSYVQKVYTKCAFPHIKKTMEDLGIERIRIKGDIQTLTAQVRTSGTVLSLIPVFLTLILWFINPGYLMSLQGGGVGCVIGVIVSVIFLIVLGYVIMMKIADIEV